MKSMKIAIFVLGIGLLLSGCAIEEIEGIRIAASKVLPQEANVKVVLDSNLVEPTLIISAHLLEGRSPDEDSPYVRGDYATHEKLTRLIRYRSAKIIKSVANEVLLLDDVRRIKVQTKHGVRQKIYNSSVIPERDVAMTIYMINVSTDDMVNRDWSNITEEDVMELWEVEKNIISKLHFRIVGWTPYK